MKAGIAVDDWKLPIFRRRLTEAGFEYTDAGAIIGQTTMLHVEYDADTFAKLTALVTACQADCARQKRNNK